MVDKAKVEKIKKELLRAVENIRDTHSADGDAFEEALKEALEEWAEDVDRTDD